MFDETDREFHERRARAELDLGYRSVGHQGMTAHFRLASLHMAKLRLLVSPPPAPARGLFGDPGPTGLTTHVSRQGQPMARADMMSR